MNNTDSPNSEDFVFYALANARVLYEDQALARLKQYTKNLDHNLKHLKSWDFSHYNLYIQWFILEISLIAVGDSSETKCSESEKGELGSPWS